MTSGLARSRWNWFLAAYVALVGVLLFAVPAHSTSTPPVITVANVTVSENAGSAQVVILKAKASSYSKVNVQTVDGTAKAGIDYNPVNVTITLANSATSYRLPIAIIDNATYQGSRSFTVKLTAARFASVPSVPATVTINDNETAPPSATWTKCAREGTVCSVVGTANVRYGFGTTWTAPRSVAGSITCDNSVWGDPLPGVTKECDTDGTTAAPVPAPTPVPTPAPTPVSACKPLTMTGSEPTPPSADMLCIAVKTCQDYRIGLVPFAGPYPVVEHGQQYYVVRGLLWHGLDDQHVVAWVPNGGSFPGFIGGAFFDRSCFEQPAP